MFGDGPLSFQEFVMREPHPLATIHDAVLEFLRGRDDAALFGAQAVNAYVDEMRMTQDVDILSTRAPSWRARSGSSSTRGSTSPSASGRSVTASAIGSTRFRS